MALGSMDSALPEVTRARPREKSWLEPIWQSWYAAGLASPFPSSLEDFALLALGKLRSSGLGPCEDGRKKAFFFFLLSPRTLRSCQEAALMSKMSEISPTKHSGYLLQDPWHRPPGESFIPPLLPVRANKHVRLQAANGAPRCLPGRGPPTRRPAGHPISCPPPAVEEEKFFERAANPGLKTPPQPFRLLAASFQRWQQPCPLHKGLAGCQRRGRIASASRFLPDPGRSGIQPCPAQISHVTSLPCGVLAPNGAGTGGVGSPCPPGSSAPLLNQPTRAKNPGARLPRDALQPKTRQGGGMESEGEKQPLTPHSTPTTPASMSPQRAAGGLGMGTPLGARSWGRPGGSPGGQRRRWRGGKRGEQSPSSGVNPGGLGAAAPQRCSPNTNSLFLLRRQLLRAIGKRPPSPWTPCPAARSRPGARVPAEPLSAWPKQPPAEPALPQPPARPFPRACKSHPRLGLPCALPLLTPQSRRPPPPREGHGGSPRAQAPSPRAGARVGAGPGGGDRGGVNFASLLSGAAFDPVRGQINEKAGSAGGEVGISVGG